MKNLYKTLCAVLAAAMLALTVLPAGVLAAEGDVAINAQNFPDENFRAWLQNPANLNGAGADDILSAEELAAVTSLELAGQNIADLTGIEHFTALETLNVSNNRLTQFDASMLKKLRFLHIDYNRLTYLDMSNNPALEGNGFVAANNWLDSLTLPDIPDFTVEAEVFCEQNPRTGYGRTEWYYDSGYTRPIREDDVIPATGQTVYAWWVPNPYTVYYRANGGTGSMADQTVVYDQEFTLTPNAFSRTGYTFAGWHTYADGSGGIDYADGATVCNLAGENSSRDAAL